MSDRAIGWVLKGREIQFRTDKVSSIDLVLNYPERVCEMHIALSRPLDKSIQDGAFVNAELFRLHAALGDLLSATPK